MDSSIGMCSIASEDCEARQLKRFEPPGRRPRCNTTLPPAISAIPTSHGHGVARAHSKRQVVRASSMIDGQIACISHRKFPPGKNVDTY